MTAPLVGEIQDHHVTVSVRYSFDVLGIRATGSLAEMEETYRATVEKLITDAVMTTAGIDHLKLRCGVQVQASPHDEKGRS